MRDPKELTNVYSSPSYAVLRAELLTRLTDWLVLTSDITPELEDSRGLPAMPNPVNPQCVVQPLPPPTPSPAPPPLDYLAINGVH